MFQTSFVSEVNEWKQESQSRYLIIEERVENLKHLSKEGGAIEGRINLTLIETNILDCENSTQCHGHQACLDSRRESGRMLCEPVCER